MKNTGFVLLLFLTIQTIAVSDIFDLKRCVSYAIKNRSESILMKLDSAISEKQIKEHIGSALPQIEANGSITDNISIATQMMPGSMIGKNDGSMLAVEMGTKYNIGGSITLTQKIYDDAFWVGLDAAKLNSKFTNQKMIKEIENIIYDVFYAYYKVIIEQKLAANLKELVNSSFKTLNSLEIKYQNGAARKLDVDKLRVSYNKSKSQLEQSYLYQKQYINNLKFAIGMPISDTINIADIDELRLINKVNIDSSKIYSITNRIDYEMQKMKIELQELNKKKYQSEYYPIVSLSANYNVQAMRSELDLFNFKRDYYGSSSIALNVNFPIFTGLSSSAKIEQAELNTLIEKENLKSIEQSINTNIANYLIQYKTAVENINNKKDNLNLAQSVLESTQLEFAQGKISSLELINAEASFKEAQNDFYSQLLILCIAELDFEKQKGTIIDFINNIK